MSYQVKLENFEGPLDLLLHLTQQLEIDIYHIPVHEITDQYMMYIRDMKQIELNVASEYLVMAATLLELKSKMLLPTQEDESLEDWEEAFEDEGDPAVELAEKLLMYKRYKEAASRLRESELEQSRLFSRPCHSLPAQKIEPGDALQNVSLFDLTDCLLQLKNRSKEKVWPKRSVERDETPIRDRMDEVVKRLGGRQLSFIELIGDNSQPKQVVVTFLAVLELLKMKKIGYEQGSNFSSIELYLTDEASSVTNEVVRNDG
ncbi:segregation/condensation protein A [Bacillaceae bacterium SIJ1]|uniref:segregation and condensation protein A n=1 Tax=Litoribacterium kuwaitense TaxID=1398745 RepID=UPI0013EBD606|nr:segregation/condensation protein A [Litoribacterium kuwaitense]NGP43663.1 segregation/condensation protein A [Litoribacterium kuwaitense]